MYSLGSNLQIKQSYIFYACTCFMGTTVKKDKLVISYNSVVIIKKIKAASTDLTYSTPKLCNTRCILICYRRQRHHERRVLATGRLDKPRVALDSCLWESRDEVTCTRGFPDHNPGDTADPTVKAGRPTVDGVN